MNRLLLAAGGLALVVAMLAAWLITSSGYETPAAAGTGPTVGLPSPRAGVTATGTAAAPAPTAPAAVIDPRGKYLGVCTPGTVAAWTSATGTRPNLIEEFMGWGQPLPPVTGNWAAGELTLISFSSDATTLPAIASGKDDAYLRRIAEAARADGVPVGLDFDHEFNGAWYPWGAGGSQHATPGQFVAAWRHMHDVFTAAGADNVIWTWSPNVVNPLPDVRLAAYWPGAAYVDWAGMVGYWTGYEGQDAYTSLYEPTERQIEALADVPILITETGVQQGPNKPAWTTDLLTGVEHDAHVIGAVYFDYGLTQHKRADWTLEDDPAALTAWRAAAAGFPLAALGSAP